MPTLDVRDRSNKVVGQVELGDAVFDRKIKKTVLHQVIVHHEAARHRGTHATKTRSEVVGSKRKPWRQKGTGRARAGDRRSPLWRSGGTTFGPRPRSHANKLPRKKMRLALQMALSSKCGDGKIFVLDELAIDEPKTRQVAALLAALELDGRTLIYDAEGSEELVRAARNIPHVSVVTGYGLSVYDLLLHDNLLVSKAGITRIDEALR